MANPIKPHFNFGPGDFIREELEVREWTQEEFADIIGLSEKSVSHIINHKQPITLETAQKLGKVFGQSPQYWMNADTNYRLRLEENEESKELNDIEKKSVIHEHMPIKAMCDKGWFNETDSVEELEKQVKDFWAIDNINFDFLESYATPSYRKSEAYSQFNNYYALTWFRKAKIEASKKNDLKSYDIEEAKEIADNFTGYGYSYKGFDRFFDDLKKAGIRFLVQPHLPKTYLDGAAFIANGNPTIVYTGRYNREDNFWFTIAHEFGHVLLHLNSEDDFFLDDLKKTNTEDKKEKEADTFANEIIRSKEILNFFDKFGPNAYITQNRLEDCARYLGINESIIVGVLQYNEKLGWNKLNKYKPEILEKIPEEYFVN